MQEDYSYVKICLEYSFPQWRPNLGIIPIGRENNNFSKRTERDGNHAVPKAS